MGIIETIGVAAGVVVLLLAAVAPALVELNDRASGPVRRTVSGRSGRAAGQRVPTAAWPA
ncbi:hypothetical protein SAMN05421810_103563 [Amycolatopsis arida]|uniref:Uncharacterized protein n=1 Tax=Amycolatopsis arida TaxID=587909 RepID=A0A1I5TKN0_9PSEU|nr:hypothetical protein [Amycolatopsis arida]TDX96059.1 hypothetical protein CLV69_103194 [Amycolatopsis arida]SFP83629.1 hypothetical protein SAMN05421810_103563 [Amycolatopsis arida]